MEREILHQLISWKSKPSRKPLLLEGARQVGKTYTLCAFGKREFPKYHLFDFEEDRSLAGIFATDLKPDRIISDLSLKAGQQINPEKELLIFDEVQKVPSAITSLKHIAQHHPTWFVIASGSLLGIGLSEISFPVGQVERLRMYPMSFYEFLRGVDQHLLADRIQAFKFSELQSEVLHQEAWKQLKYYFITGGLPEAIKAYSQQQDNLPDAFRKIRQVQRTILQDYKDDIAKHSGKLKAVKIDAVFESIPFQLARENQGVKKFVFKGVLERNSKYSELEAPIQWLERAGLVHKIPICERAALPLRAFASENRFVLYLFDIGILGAMIELAPETIVNYNYGTYKRYFAENFVLQELKPTLNSSLYNWQENTSQIEFVTAYRDSLLALEVKAGVNTKAKSLNVFENKYKPKASFLFCGKAYFPPRNNRYVLPLYLSAELEKLLADIPIVNEAKGVRPI